MHPEDITHGTRATLERFHVEHHEWRDCGSCKGSGVAASEADRIEQAHALGANAWVNVCRHCAGRGRRSWLLSPPREVVHERIPVIVRDQPELLYIGEGEERRAEIKRVVLADQREQQYVGHEIFFVARRPEKHFPSRAMVFDLSHGTVVPEPISEERLLDWSKWHVESEYRPPRETIHGLATSYRMESRILWGEFLTIEPVIR